MANYFERVLEVSTTDDAAGTGIIMIYGKFTGGASSAATKNYGQGWSVAGSGSGVYTLTFSPAPTTLLCFLASVGAATPANVDTYTIVHDDYASSAIPLTASEAGTPTDLAASEYCNFAALFAI